MHSTETCITNPPIARKVQRKGLYEEMTGMEIDFGVGIRLYDLHRPPGYVKMIQASG